MRPLERLRQAPTVKPAGLLALVSVCLLATLNCGSAPERSSGCPAISGAVTETPPRGWYPGSAVFDPVCGRVLAFGGVVGTGGQLSNATWTWMAGRWTRLNPPHRPTARTLSAMAFEARHKTVVLYGGQQDLGSVPSGAATDTWTWDGGDWHEMRTARTPMLRHPVATYDATWDQVVVVGLDSDYRGFGTWAWSGEDWRPLPAMPVSAIQAGLVYDPPAGRVLLFGGFNQSMGPLGDTWQLREAGWVRLQPATAPLACLDPALGFDPISKHVLLTGGETQHQQMTDTWAWDGSTWLHLPATASAPARFLPPLIYDLRNWRLLGLSADPAAPPHVWAWTGRAWRPAS